MATAEDGDPNVSPKNAENECGNTFALNLSSDHEDDGKGSSSRNPSPSIRCVLKSSELKRDGGEARGICHNTPLHTDSALHCAFTHHKYFSPLSREAARMPSHTRNSSTAAQGRVCAADVLCVLKTQRRDMGTENTPSPRARLTPDVGARG